MPLIIPGNRQASTGYTIGQSIRFNDDDTAYMHRTPSSSGNRDKWTWSSWIKRGNLTDANATLFQAGDDSQSANYTTILFNGNSGGEPTLKFNSVIGSATKLNLATTQYFRDVSAWYHIVCVYDSGNDVSSERARIYINGTRVTDFGTETYPDQNQDSMTNHTVKQSIGRRNQDSSRYMDGYMAEIHLLDGYAYDPSFFGEFNSSGIWIPKEYTGSYGTNGFKIDGRDSSDLGDDESGNGNDFTTSGMDASDQKADTPTNNQITFNPLNNQRSGGSPSNGNLDYVGPGTRTIISLTANIPSTGKWAIAYKVAQVSTSSGWQIGISTASDSDFGDAVGSNEDLDLVRMQTTSSDLKIKDAVNNTDIDPSLPVTTSDEFWVAVDMDSGKVFLGIYDASDTSMKFVANDAGLDGNPATGDNPTVTFTTAQMPRDDVVFSVGSKQTSQYIYLQRSTDVSGTTPTGYTYFENVKDLI